MAKPGGSVGKRPRGRPQRLPFDTSTATSPTVDGNKRLAWLMATTRIVPAGPDGTSRAEFAARLHAEGVRADSSRISRWESGLEVLPEHLVRAYESATGTTPYTLEVVRRSLIRSGDLVERAHRRQPAEIDESRIDTLLDHVTDGEIDGSGWLELSDGLGAYDQIYLPEAVWRQLSDRLVGELIRTTGLGYARRHEAAATLMLHRKAGIHLSHAIGRFTLAPGAQLLVPPLALLCERPNTAVRDLVLKMMSSSATGLRGGAEVAASRLIATGGLSPTTPALEQHVGYAVQQADVRLASATTELATRLADTEFHRVLNACRDPRLRTWLLRTRETNEVVESDQARAISDRIALGAEAACHRAAQDPDPMLRTFIREALFHAHRSRRRSATMILMASPYASAIASAALVLTTEQQRTLGAAAWSLAVRMGSLIDRDDLLEAAIREKRPGLRARAITCLGFVQGPLTADVIAGLERAAADPEGQAGAQAALLALGLKDARESLERLRGGQHGPAIEWWLENRQIIHER